MTRSTKPQSRPPATLAPRRTASKPGPKSDRIVATAAVVAAAEEQHDAGIHGGSLLFDPDWYRTEYPDVAAAGIDPIRHYFDDGAREGRDPNPFFSTISYMARYADVAASRMNPFLHYLLYGAREGRTPRG